MTPLNGFQAAAGDYVADCADRFLDGARLAGQEIEVLQRMAEAMVLAVATFEPLARRLDAGRARAFDPDRAVDLILESAFDDLLTPAAYRVLAEAVRLRRA